jgi:hypothetical protein
MNKKTTNKPIAKPKKQREKIVINASFEDIVKEAARGNKKPKQ